MPCRGGRWWKMEEDVWTRQLSHFPRSPACLSLQSVLVQPLEGHRFPTLSGFVTGSEWRCKFLLVAAAFQEFDVGRESQCTLKDPEWLVQDVFFVTDDYHKDKILQLSSPAVQNNLSCSRLTAINQLVLAKHSVSSGTLVLSCCESARLRSKKILPSESILSFQNLLIKKKVMLLKCFILENFVKYIFKFKKKEMIFKRW